MSAVLEPVALGEIVMRNRVVMAPILCDDASPKAAAHLYAQCALAGLIVTEGVDACGDGQGHSGAPGRHSADQVEIWRGLAEGVQAQGCRIVMQLTHCGGVALSDKKRAEAGVMTPFEIPDTAAIPGVPRARRACAEPDSLTPAEIIAVIADYRQAALNAIAAGWDGVELDAASGCLPMAFLSSNRNRREDLYGGSSENRCRFVVDVMQAMAEAIGPGRVGIRIHPGAPGDARTDAVPAATHATLLRALSGRGFAYVHLINRPTRALDTLMMTRGYWSGPLIVNDERAATTGEALLASGQADAVSWHWPSAPAQGDV